MQIWSVSDFNTALHRNRRCVKQVLQGVYQVGKPGIVRVFGPVWRSQGICQKPGQVMETILTLDQSL